MTAFVGVPFVAIAIRGRSRAAPAVAALYVATMALICSAVVALEVPALVLAMVLGLETVIVTGAPSRQVTRFPMRLTWQPLVIPLVLGLVPWLLYAWSMWSLNRQSRPERDITIGVDHYAVQGAYALATLMLVALAVLWPAGRVFLALIAGVAAVYLGVVSWFWYPTPARSTAPGRDCAPSGASPSLCLPCSLAAEPPRTERLPGFSVGLPGVDPRSPKPQPPRCRS